jgi:hypothetical protein
MILTHLLLFRQLGGARSLVGLTQRSRVSTTVPLALGIFNSASNAAVVAGVASVRITSSMA